MTEQFIKEIEEGKVYADLMLANTPEALLKRMARNTTLAEVRYVMGAEPVSDYLERAHHLYLEQTSPGYAYPFDLAIAAYAYLISYQATPDAYAFLRELAATYRSDIGSAKVVACQMLEQLEQAPSNEVQRQESSHPPPFASWEDTEETYSDAENRLSGDRVACSLLYQSCWKVNDARTPVFSSLRKGLRRCRHKRLSPYRFNGASITYRTSRYSFAN